MLYVPPELAQPLAQRSCVLPQGDKGNGDTGEAGEAEHGKDRNEHIVVSARMVSNALYSDRASGATPFSVIARESELPDAHNTKVLLD